MWLILAFLACSSTQTDSDSGLDAGDECYAPGNADSGGYAHDWWDDACIDEGYSCRFTCETLHSGDETGREGNKDARPGCNIATGDRTAADLLSACTAGCEVAVAVVEGAATYSGTDRTSVGDGPPLANRADAVAWGTCVEEHTCPDLNDGYCAAAY